MIKRLELRPSEQRVVLARYLRTLRANCNRAYRELLEISRVRRGCPFERHLRYKRLDDANELLKLGKKCLDEINRCYALRLAAFAPGDQVVVKTTIPGFRPDPRRYLVLDVEWRKRDGYIYEAHELTKTGSPHKGRYPGALCPSSRISIEKCDQTLPEETRFRADSARRAAAELLEAVLERGDLAIFTHGRLISCEISVDMGSVGTRALLGGNTIRRGILDTR